MNSVQEKIERSGDTFELIILNERIEGSNAFRLAEQIRSYLQTVSKDGNVSSSFELPTFCLLSSSQHTDELDVKASKAGIAHILCKPVYNRHFR